MSLEHLRRQGLDNFIAWVWLGQHNTDSIRIRIRGQNRSIKQRIHLRKEAARTLCPPCDIRENGIGISCNGVNPDEERYGGDTANITFDQPQSDAYILSLLARIPCRPIIED